MTDDKILIIGGYGNVGRVIARQLASLFPGRVVVAGRNLASAVEAAETIGDGAQARAIDIRSPEAATELEEIDLVVVCLDQENVGFAEQCLSRGIHYVDISAHYTFLAKVEQLDELARSHGATAILSVGVAPGLTNLLAARVVELMDRVDRLDILVELGLGDSHGRAAIEWMLDNLDAEYEVPQNGELQTVRSFDESIELPLPTGSVQRAYRFNLSDQHVLARTLGVPSVSTWVSFTSPLFTRLAARASTSPVAKWLRQPFLRRLAVRSLQNVGVGSDRCAVAVRALGIGEDGDDTCIIGVTGHNEALMTGVVAAETARQLLTNTPAPGVYHSEQVIALDQIVEALERELPGLEVDLG
jgi:short subunit dehydrogenase-like uncharacterized protein